MKFTINKNELIGVDCSVDSEQQELALYSTDNEVLGSAFNCWIKKSLRNENVVHVDVQFTVNNQSIAALQQLYCNFHDDVYTQDVHKWLIDNGLEKEYVQTLVKDSLSAYRNTKGHPVIGYTFATANKEAVDYFIYDVLYSRQPRPAGC